MPTKFVKGDLFAYPGLTAIAHGCNCAGRMARGIAVEFKNRFPIMYKEYRKLCDDRQLNIGDVFTWQASSKTSIVVFNLMTQKTWMTTAELPAVEKALRGAICQAKSMGIEKIGLPRIGAGLGKLPWDDVKKILVQVGSETSIELVVIETYVPPTTNKKLGVRIR